AVRGPTAVLRRRHRQLRSCGSHRRRLPARARSGNQPDVRLGAVERRTGAGRVEVVARVLDLERVASFADLVVGVEPVGAVDLPVAVDVEITAHAGGEGLDVEGRDALVSVRWI